MLLMHVMSVIAAGRTVDVRLLRRLRLRWRLMLAHHRMQERLLLLLLVWLVQCVRWMRRMMHMHYIISAGGWRRRRRRRCQWYVPLVPVGLHALGPFASAVALVFTATAHINNFHGRPATVRAQQ